MRTTKQVVCERQNEKFMLKTQAVARGYYNLAEALGTLAWALCILSSVSVLIQSSVYEWRIALGVLAIDIAAVFASLFQARCIERGSELRAFFDSYVLSVGHYHDNQNIEIYRDIVECYCVKHSKEIERQTLNTEYDNPPGVKNWYLITTDTTDEGVQLECQRQNIWWDRRLWQLKMKMLLLLFIVSVTFIFLFGRITDPLLLIKTAFSSALIIKCLERIYWEARYFLCSKEAEAALKVIGKTPSDEQIEVLQNYINKKRSLTVTGIDLLHKKHSKRFSELYINIKEDRY